MCDAGQALARWRSLLAAWRPRLGQPADPRVASGEEITERDGSTLEVGGRVGKQQPHGAFGLADAIDLPQGG